MSKHPAICQNTKYFVLFHSEGWNAMRLGTMNHSHSGVVRRRRRRGTPPSSAKPANNGRNSPTLRSQNHGHGWPEFGAIQPRSHRIEFVSGLIAHASGSPMTAVGMMNHSHVRRRSASNANTPSAKPVSIVWAWAMPSTPMITPAPKKPRRDHCGRDASSTIIAAKPAHRPINVLRCAYSEAEIVLSTHR